MNWVWECAVGWKKKKNVLSVKITVYAKSLARKNFLVCGKKEKNIYLCIYIKRRECWERKVESEITLKLTTENFLRETVLPRGPIRDNRFRQSPTLSLSLVLSFLNPFYYYRSKTSLTLPEQFNIAWEALLLVEKKNIQIHFVRKSRGKNYFTYENLLKNYFLFVYL